MREASRDLLAAREDVWRFLAEPYHLADWWPGLVGVDPDRRGFAAGARWEVSLIEEPVSLGLLRLPALGRASGPRVSAVLLVTGVALYEAWSWQLIRKGRSVRAVPAIDVNIRLKWAAQDRTLVTVSVSGGDAASRALFGSRDARLAQSAVDRLYDLVQTAATL
jgi:hypothetical protein